MTIVAELENKMIYQLENEATTEVKSESNDESWKEEEPNEEFIQPQIIQSYRPIESNSQLNCFDLEKDINQFFPIPQGTVPED